MAEDKKIKIEISLKITKEHAPYAPSNQLGIYKLKRWTWAEKRRASQKATTEIDVKRGIVSWDITNYYTWMIFYSVKKAPKKLEWNEKTIANLDPDVGDMLQNNCLTINTLAETDKRSFLGQLRSGTVISGLTPTGLAKTSDVSQAQDP